MLVVWELSKETSCITNQLIRTTPTTPESSATFNMEDKNSTLVTQLYFLLYPHC
ncbi:hypothetical protein L873DRAFT_1798421 [Choiromyces venosus 120613-1]|uniref:Uncharacterized protein n=1 Tax=Choiromyces venosus 120613-1 TaxID=1336337 RepID=A0A3N4K363_9PEZI|nr:hypothetical protein L873DRAFT_1798421 [Choiromyces venosus 120613-1]